MNVFATLLQAGTSTSTPAGGYETARQLQPFMSSRAAQYLATGLIISAFLVSAGAAYVLGERYGHKIDTTNIEAIQSVTITVLGVIAAVLLVFIWRAVEAVRDALAVIEPSPQVGVKLLLVVLAFGAAYTVTRITKGVVRVGEDRDAISIHQREVLHHIIQIVIFLPAVLFSLALFGVRASNLLLSAGAAGVVLGLAARQTLGAIIAGFVVLFSRPFEVGDWVRIDENEGIVTDISVVNTQIRTFDDEHVMIPNDQITDSPITNLSRTDRLRVQVDVGVDYDTDIEHAARVAVEAMESCEEVMEDQVPDVVLERFGDSAVVLNLRFWIDDPSIRRKWAAQNAVIEAVKSAFEREGIKIPFPQRELAGREETGGFQVTGGSFERDDESEDGEESEAALETGGATDDESVLDDVTPAATDVQRSDLTPAVRRIKDGREGAEGAVEALRDEDD